MFSYPIHGTARQHKDEPGNTVKDSWDFTDENYKRVRACLCFDRDTIIIRNKPLITRPARGWPTLPVLSIPAHRRWS